MREFIVPVVVFLGILGYLITKNPILAWIITLLGSFELFKDTISSVLKKQFALDYIAILAVLLSLFTGQYLVAMILSLMIASGRNLEKYAQKRAKKSLTALIERIPDKVTLWEKDHPGEELKLKNIKVNMEIFIKKGEVVPLDGSLISLGAVLDESSLTGESAFVEKVSGEQIFSGTINMGVPIALKVTKTQGNSTYNKIVEMVREAQEEKSPMVRLADKYSGYFTIITLAIAALAFIFSNFDLMRVLSVLAIATPCPLIIATPIALLGGVNSAAKNRVIIKRLSALEALSRINILIFDKTGTLTIGKPILKKVEILFKNLDEKKALAIAAAIERNSLHPLAKAVVEFGKIKNAPVLHARDVAETIGLGITGVVEEEKYLLSKRKGEVGMAIELSSKGKTLAIFKFEDEIKANSKEVINFFQNQNMKMLILTGDKKVEAQKLVKSLGEDVEIKAELKPEEKLKEVENLKKEGRVVAMVGDGINDAPALAASDVGIVFSNEEQTAASEAADIVFLGGEFASIPISYNIAKKTINIAKQSIIGGIGLSVVGMVFASVGLIPPIFGAILQEGVDVVVILNAIRASRINS